jgi:hypothetical protein
MKNSNVLSVKNLSRKFSGIICALVLSFGLFSSVHAQDNVTANDGQALIKYLGNVGDQLVFQVQVDNDSNDYCTIRIKDEAGNTFFIERFKEKNITKKFVIKKEDVGGFLTFVVKKSKNEQIESFQVDRNVRVIEDLVITKQK